MNPDALRGHMDALLLSVLEREPLHGYAIIEALQERSGGALSVPTGTVYPALRKLERAGLLSSEWATVERPPPAHLPADRLRQQAAAGGAVGLAGVRHRDRRRAAAGGQAVRLSRMHRVAQ